MADKTIGELPLAPTVNDDSLLAVEQQGTAMKMTGKQFREFGEAAAKVYVETAVVAANTATDAANRAEAARDSIVVDEQKLSDAVAAAEASQQAASSSELNAKNSEQAAAQSEQNAKASEQAAATSETNASNSEIAANLSEQNAKASEQAAATSEANAKASEEKAAQSETNASSSETNAAASEQVAVQSAEAAKLSETTAINNALLSQSWAVGGSGVRVGEATDNSKYWAGIAQAAAEQATTPIQGVYNVVLQDRVTAERYALIIENGRLQILGVSDEMDAADLNMLDIATGIAYNIIIENGILAIEEA